MLKDILFEKGKNNLTSLCLKNKTKRKQLIFKKLSTLDEKFKVAMCEAYLKRCKILYHQRSLSFKLLYDMRDSSDKEVSK
jgi:hypothetical protein